MTSILLKRTGALGDVICLTPIVRRLHVEGNEVYMMTACPEVFRGNPHVKKVLKPEHLVCKYKCIDLDLCYERTPKMHIVDAYSMAVFGDTNTDRRCELFTSASLLGILVDRPYVVLHFGKGWENRTFSESFWKNVTMELPDEFALVCIGNEQEHPWKGLSVVDLCGKLSLKDLRSVISEAELFIGPDSGPLHVAQTTDTPCIGLFTCAKAEYRLTSPHAHAVIPRDLDCYGCLHDAPPPVVYIGCRRGDFICVKERITPEMVLDKVREVLG